MEKLDPFKIIGIATESTNANGQSALDLTKLWDHFFTGDIPDKILNKMSDKIYSIYTDYESDYSGKSLVIIGMKIDSLDTIPEGMMRQEVTGG